MRRMQRFHFEQQLLAGLCSTCPTTSPAVLVAFVNAIDDGHLLKYARAGRKYGDRMYLREIRASAARMART